MIDPDIGEITFSRGTGVVGIDHQSDSTDLGRLLSEEGLIIFIDVSGFGNPLSETLFSALKDDITGVRRFLADHLCQFWRACFPEISDEAGVDHLGKAGEHDINLGRLVVFVFAPDVSPFRKTGDLPFPMEDRGNLGIEFEFPVNTKAVFIAEHTKKPVFTLFDQFDQVPIPKPLSQTPSYRKTRFVETKGKILLKIGGPPKTHRKEEEEKKQGKKDPDPAAPAAAPIDAIG